MERISTPIKVEYSEVVDEVLIYAICKQKDVIYCNASIYKSFYKYIIWPVWKWKFDVKIFHAESSILQAACSFPVSQLHNTKQ